MYKIALNEYINKKNVLFVNYLREDNTKIQWE